jgi:RNA polymerase sigma-70 factor (sigma-E family)
VDDGERRRAFEELYIREFPAAVRTAYLVCGDREEAVDVAQEAFARAFARWPAIERTDRPGAWVHSVVTNLALTWLRRVRRIATRRITSPEVSEPAIEDPSIVTAIRLLPPAQRAVVVLRYYVDMSVEDVALALGKRPGTVRVLAHKGLARLRGILPREEVR